jgi:hypothetical protein
MPDIYTVLPENECCLGPYEVITSLSKTGTHVYYDSGKTLLKCKNASCTGSCEAEYGHIYDVIDDYTDNCPSCRECYLEDSSMGRYYTLIITNCEIIITNYVSENECGTCLQHSESFCFSMLESGDLDPDNPRCYASFTFDGQTFTVYGVPGQCGSEIDCGDCWERGNAVLTENSALPEISSDCTTDVEIQSQAEEAIPAPVEISWHNSPLQSGDKNTGCTSEILIPSSEEERNSDGRSFQNPSIDIASSGHAIIAYEDRSFSGLTKINFSEQETTVQKRIIGNRTLGKGRLLNTPIDGESGKIRIYDDILTNTTGSIGFKTGPLSGKLYTISSIAKEPNSSDTVYSVENKNIYSFYYDRTYNKLYAVTLGAISNIYSFDPVTSATATEINIGFPDLTYITAFVVDSENRIYYCLRATDDTGVNYEIYRRPFDSVAWSQIHSFVSSGNHYNSALELDFNNGYIYYSKQGEIRKIKTDGSGDSSIITTLETDILSIKIDSVYNRLYWTEYNNGKIASSKLDGTDEETIIENSNHRPYGLDIQPNKIYWSDTKHQAIKGIKRDGTDIFVYLSLNNVEKIPTALHINENSSKIFFINGTSSGIDNFSIISNGKINKSILTNRPFCEIEFSLE